MKPNHNNQEAGTDAIAADAGVVCNSASRNATQADGQEACGVRVAGAPPSITAPANSIRPLRHGVDSLYLSFPGCIDPIIAIRLQDLKQMAQTNNERVVAEAAARIGGHLFEVRPRGRGRFPFVLEDNWASIQLSNASAGIMPLALVQIRSEYLTAVGPHEAVATITKLIDRFGQVAGPAKISRIDLFADFCTDHDLVAAPGSNWIKRSKKRSIHEEADQVTGISFGSGNEVSGRLYDKTLEIQKSGKDYMRPLWALEGWDAVSQVWRMEFQIRREGLPQEMLGDASEVFGMCGSLWRYLCGDWLRLAIPSASDDTRSRWPTHPLWEDLSRVWDIDPEAPPLTRVPKSRCPSDDQLFRNGISGLTSFMAREGITDYAEGMGEFLQAFEAYHENPLGQFPGSLRSYVSRKTKAKARRYNVALDSHERE